MKNAVHLITYADRLGGGDLKSLQALLSGPLAGLFGGVHLLPFFDPIDGDEPGLVPSGELDALVARPGVGRDINFPEYRISGW